MATANASLGSPDDESAAVAGAQVRQAGGTLPDRAAFELDGCDSTSGRRSDPRTDQPRPSSECDEVTAVQKQPLQLPGLETY